MARPHPHQLTRHGDWSAVCVAGPGGLRLCTRSSSCSHPRVGRPQRTLFLRSSFDSGRCRAVARRRLEQQHQWHLRLPRQTICCQRVKSRRRQTAVPCLRCSGVRRSVPSTASVGARQDRRIRSRKTCKRGCMSRHHRGPSDAGRRGTTRACTFCTFPVSIGMHLSNRRRLGTWAAGRTCSPRRMVLAPVGRSPWAHVGCTRHGSTRASSHGFVRHRPAGRASAGGHLRRMPCALPLPPWRHCSRERCSCSTQFCCRVGAAVLSQSLSKHRRAPHVTSAVARSAVVVDVVTCRRAGHFAASSPHSPSGGAAWQETLPPERLRTHVPCTMCHAQDLRAAQGAPADALGPPAKDERRRD